VFIFDIDQLKFVNDSFGHLKGDELIVGVSDILKNILGKPIQWYALVVMKFWPLCLTAIWM